MNIKNLFRRKKQEKPEPQPLRIEGVPEAPLTPEPDDAELAAQALLELMVQGEGLRVKGSKPGDKEKDNRESLTVNHEPIHDAAYFKALASRIKTAQEAARLRTMRFVAFCEQELKKHDLPLEGPGSLGLLNVELMKRIDTIERVGGDLKRRWQHCLAEVTVRLMKATSNHNDNDNLNDNDNGNDNGNGNCYDHELLEFHECF